MTNRLLFISCALAGCAPSEGGLQLSYGLYRSDGTTPARNCFDIQVSQIRVVIGNDDNRNMQLEDEEMIGRALADCNQSDADQNGQLSLADLGRFETPSDRLPTGEFNTMLIQLTGIDGGDVPVRFHASPNGFSNGGVVFYSTSVAALFEIKEGEITQFSFSGFMGGFQEARFVTNR